MTPTIHKRLNRFDMITPYQEELQKRTPSVVYMILILSLLSITPGLANTSFNPAILEVANDYQVSTSHIQALATNYFLGLGIGQLVWGPLTDRFGRRPIVLVAGILAIIINFVFINTQTYEQLSLARFLQGLIFSAMGLLPTAVLRDVYSARDFVVYNSWVVILFLLAPAFAPIMGGFVLISLGWRWIFTCVSAVSAIACILYLMRIPETLDPAKKQPINPIRICKNYWELLSNLRSLLSLIIAGCIALVLFSWTALSAAILIDDWGVAPQNFWMYTIVPLIFNIASNKINGSLIRKYSPQRILLVASICQTIFALANLIIAWYFLGPWGLVVAQVVNSMFVGFTNANNISIFLMDYPHMVGTASSMILSFRVLIPAILIYFISFSDRGMGKTFLYFDAAVIVLTCALILLQAVLYPQPGSKVHSLRVQSLKQASRATKIWN